MLQLLKITTLIFELLKQHRPTGEILKVFSPLFLDCHSVIQCFIAAAVGSTLPLQPDEIRWLCFQKWSRSAKLRKINLTYKGLPDIYIHIRKGRGNKLFEHRPDHIFYSNNCSSSLFYYSALIMTAVLDKDSLKGFPTYQGSRYWKKKLAQLIQ